ncbi:hypothetical protein GTR22_004977 [Salmonella enterica]|nr:hypothetical protein [Salmonella enterica]
MQKKAQPFTFQTTFEPKAYFRLVFKINILRHSRRFFRCACKALLPAAP